MLLQWPTLVLRAAPPPATAIHNTQDFPGEVQLLRPRQIRTAGGVELREERLGARQPQDTRRIQVSRVTNKSSLCRWLLQIVAFVLR